MIKFKNTRQYKTVRSKYIQSIGIFRSGCDFIFNTLLMKIPSRRLRHHFIKRKLNQVGSNSSFLRNIEVRVGENISVGNNTVINQKVLLDGRGGKLIIGNNVDIAQETNIWTLEHDVHEDYHQSIGSDVIIEDYVWIASRVTILPGVTIGRGAVVACNSVVTKDVEPLAIVAGIPAKPIGQRRSKLKYKLLYSPIFR